MDMAASITGSIVVEAGRHLCGSIYSNISNTVRIQSNIQVLEKEMENLISIRNDMKSQLAKAEKDGKLPTIQVKEWLRNVEDFMIEVELIQEGKTANKKKLTRCFFSCSLRYSTCKKVSRMLKEVKNLVKAGSFPGGLLTDIDTAITVEHIPGPSIQDQTTASRTLAKVMDLLKNDGVQRIGVWVSELVRYWLAEGLIDEQENYEDSINRGIALIENLKDYCLLEGGDREGTVKMHDVVRDVAIWIGSCLEDRYKSLVRSGMGLNEISEVKLLNSLKRVSFMNNKIKSLPDCEIQCSEASTLLLQGNFPLDRIPVTFLQGFPAIRVLNMSGTRIQSLPLSLLQLHDLRALILRDCFYLTDLPSLGGLTKLQVLDLCATSITELPRGLENLSKLRQLNLSRTHYLKTVQAGTISRLHSLEVLDMTLSDYHWGVKGQVEEGQITFEDLGCLQRLQVLFIRLEGIPSLGSENLAWIGRVKRYQFFIGPTANSLPTKHDKRRVTISGLNLSGEWIDWFLSNATSLVLNHCWGLNQMLETLVIDSIDCFTSLKSLTIANSNSYLRPDGGCAAHVDLLPNLEELHLHDLTYLESISELVGHLGLRFCRLKLIEVTRCSRLKYVLSYGSLILSLPNLEEIKVSFCDNLVQLFNYCSKQDFNPEPVVPNLRNLELKNLPKLRSLCRYEECWQHLEQVEVIKSNLLTKMPLTTKNENNIKEIRGELQWWNQLDCDNETKLSLQPYFKQTGAKQELRSMEMQKIDGMVL
ncbi:hypothetical protein LWI28_006970 [Acer negundo]|uniref:Rx N-terminal domain-containing protein n=1 Tax=Acer negundo TaxID=4023 RepID=A0AAD5J3F7_ACENE|nr:hypothetical protein LWI28_006970 [Acer negundo]